jgi:hypothetical protein
MWFFIILSFLSCRDEEGIWDELSPAEQAAVRLRAYNKCISNSSSQFTNFLNQSEGNFFGDDAFDRGTTFNHTFKEGDTIDFTHKITIWKTTSTDVYLLIFVDDATDQYQFLKIPRTSNEEMISQMQIDYCNQDLSLSLSNSSYKYETETTTKKTTFTYTYSTSLLAYLSVYKLIKKEQPLDEDGNPTGTETTSTGTLSSAVTENNIPEYDSYADYVSTGVEVTLCVVNSTTIPFSLRCDSTGATTFLASELAL